MRQKIIIIGFISLVTALIGGEMIIRKFSKTGYITPEILKNLSLQYDPSIFSKSVFPRKEQKTKGENNADIYINQMGYRGREFTVNKPKGFIRLMFYGGSSVFDIAQSEGHDWPHLVETMLKDKGFKNVEVVNAGVPSHATFDAIGMYLAEGHFFQPDFVFLSSSWNDIKYFLSQKPILRQFKPYRQNENPFINYFNPVDRFLSEKSQLYVRLRTRYFLTMYKVSEEGIESTGELADDFPSEGLKQYKLNIEAFIDIVRNSGSIPILITEPHLVIDNNTDSQKTRIKYRLVKLTHKALNNAFQGTESIIKDVSQQKKVELIDASAYISGKDKLFRDQVHMTEEGSNAMASLISTYMAKILTK